MTTLPLLLPDDVRQLAEAQIADGRYGTISEYVAALIRRDRDQMQTHREAKILRERVQAPVAGEMTHADFSHIRQRLEAEIERRRGA